MLRANGQQELLQKELDSNFTDPEAMSENRLKQLSFLNACIREALRMAPTINTRFLSRTSPGTEIDGTYIPKGVSHSQNLPCLFKHAELTRNR